MIQPEPQPQLGSVQSPPQQQAAQVDLAQLAERVYRLMLAELRLEQRRGARPGQPKPR